MAKGYNEADWAVDLHPVGRGGTVRYGSLRGAFGGAIISDRPQIVWKATPWPEGADTERMRQAAAAAVRSALKRG